MKIYISSLKSAVDLTGHADPETKIAAWLKIGEEIQKARKIYGVKSTKGSQRNYKDYQAWLKKSGLTPSISMSTLSQSAQLFENRTQLRTARKNGELPSSWSSPSTLNKALRWIRKGLNPLFEEAKQHKRLSRIEKATLWSDGLPGGFHLPGAEFQNMMNRLARMSLDDQIRAIGAFFGTNQHQIKIEWLDNYEGIHVWEQIPEKISSANRAYFDVTIMFKKINIKAAA